MVRTPALATEQTEQFLGKKDHLKTKIKVEPGTRSVIITYGDKYGSYVIDGVITYENDWYSGTLKTFTDFRRSSPYLCLTVNPEVHKYLTFDLLIKGGKVKSITQSSTPCNKYSKEKERELTEEEQKKEKKKGFLEQLNDLLRTSALIFLALLLIAVVVLVVLLWKGIL